MTDKNLFEIELKKKGKTKQDIADLLEISLQTVYNKLNNIVDFKTSELVKICDFLNVTKKDREAIFFAKRVE